MNAPDVALDCLYFEQFMGNECCSRYGINLEGGETSPCSFCKHYVKTKGEQNEEVFKAVADRSVDPDHPVCDSTGQYYILGM